MRYVIVAVLVLCGSFAQADELQDANDQYEALDEQGKYQEALPFAQKAVRLAETKFGKESGDTSVYLSNLGSLYATLGDYDKAEPLYKRALEIDEKALGPDHPDVATGLNNLGLLYDDLGDYDKAEPLYERALEILEKQLGPDHPQVATGLNNLGSLYNNLGDYDKAEPLYKRALEIQEKALGPDHPITVELRDGLNKFSQRYGLRTWTDITGKFSREAHFVSLSDGVVEIQLATGEKKSILLEKLSDADQEYATKTQILLDEDAEPAEEDPFQ